MFYMKASGAEDQKKRITQELECQRHNAEAARQALETKLKDKEKEFKLELGQQTDLLREAEKHLNDTVNKMQQDINKVCIKRKYYSMLIECPLCVLNEDFSDLWTWPYLRHLCEILIIVSILQVQNEANQIRGQLERSEHKIIELEKDKKESLQKITSAEHSMKTHDVVVAQMKTNIDALKKDKVCWY